MVLRVAVGLGVLVYGMHEGLHDLDAAVLLLDVAVNLGLDLELVAPGEALDDAVLLDELGVNGS